MQPITNNFVPKDVLYMGKTQDETIQPTSETLRIKSVENYACSTDK